MECDDQKDILCSFSVQDLPFPLSEVRLVMWETQEVKISSAGQSVSGGTTGEPTDSKILCSTSLEKQQAVKLLTEPERVKGSSETASEQDVRARFERKNLEVLPSSAATPCVSDKQTSLENQLPGKATHNRWPKRTAEIGKNVSNSSAKKGTSAETLRIQRMRERFLKDKQKLEARRPTLDIENFSSNNPLIPHYAGSVTKNTVQSDPQKCDTSRNGTEPVQQCLQASSAKRLDNRCADQTAEGNAAKLQNTVLDRVLKYLPKGAVPKLPFINIEQTSSIDKSKSKGKGKVSFQGYVPKSTITKSNCENRELSASEKDTSDANGSSSLEKPVDRTESLRESCNQRTNKLRLSVSPGRAGIMLTTDLSPFKKRLKRNTEELQGSQVTPVKGIFTLTKRRLDSSGSLPIKKRHLSIPGITPVTSDHERVVHSQEYSSHNVASTANQMNHSQNTGDKAELLKTPQISSANGTTAFHSPCGLNEMESTAFSQSTMWPDNNNADMFGLGQCSLDADLTMLNNFAASPIKAPHLSIDSWIEPSYTEHLPVASGPDFSPTFASYPYCQSAHPVNMDRRSSEHFLVNPVLSDSPEKTNTSLLMDGRTKVHWS